MKTKTGSLIVGAMLVVLLIVGAGYADLTDGLMAYYPFSGNASPGTEYGGPSYVPGPIGQAIKFDGADDWVHDTCEDIIVAGTQASFAITFWFKPTITWTPEAGYPNGVLVGNVQHNIASDWNICAGSATAFGRLEFNLYSANYPSQPTLNLYTTTNTWPADTWAHVVYSHDAGTQVFSVWVNGVFENSTSTSGHVGKNTAGEDITVARYDNQYVAMTFDELRLYNRALSECEIQQLAGTTIEATVDIDPDTLNLGSNGKWVTCYIELPQGCDVLDIDGSTVLLEGIPAYIGKEGWARAGANSGNILDHDGDGIQERMVKFDGAAVREYLLGLDVLGDIALTVTGDLVDGPSFEGFGVVHITQGGN